MDPKNLNGFVKVAIFVKSLGKEAAQGILRGMSSSERELVEAHLAQLGKVSPDLTEKIAKEFTEIVEQKKHDKREVKKSKNEDDDGQKTKFSNLNAILFLPLQMNRNLLQSYGPNAKSLFLRILK